MIIIDRVVVERALDALESAHKVLFRSLRLQDAITVLREALAQPQQEPVAFVKALNVPAGSFVTDLKYCSVAEHERRDHLNYIPLFTPPKAAAQPLDCLHINEGSADEAALTYEAEYWAEMAQGKADADTRRGAVQRVGYYVRDAILRMQAQASHPLTASEVEEADGDRGIPKDAP